MVGHSGKNGCHLYCGVLSHQNSHGHHYYPAFIKLRDQCALVSETGSPPVLSLIWEWEGNP